jgi:hypothetical protein
MALSEQWQLTAKFADLADFIVKKCPATVEREAALEALTVAMSKSQLACSVTTAVKSTTAKPGK